MSMALLGLGCGIQRLPFCSSFSTSRFSISFLPYGASQQSARCIISCSRSSSNGGRSHYSWMDPVVSSDWLSHRLADVCILDVRGSVVTNSLEDGVEKSEYVMSYDDYLEGHIPGSVFIDWVKDGVDSTSDIPVQLTTDSEEFTVLMEGKGVSTEKDVVVYDCGDGLLAPRIWWALVMHGHPSVYVLDGGWKKWMEEGRDMEIAEPCPLKIYAKYEPGEVKFIPRISSKQLVTLILQEKTHSSITASEDNLKIIDARSQEQYDGFVRRSKHGGRIPGAINLPRKRFLQPSGVYKSIEEQRKVFLDAGVNPEQPTRLVAYCNGGVASCTILLAWARVGGVGTWANYDGSWNEWGNSDDLPKEL
eukprot:c12135_g1_i1 orf=124-1209(-)